jgi:hypothetical protein
VNKLYSASEIAGMRLPGLPTSKSAIINRAAQEGWYFEERPGLGGMRREYEVPAKYLSKIQGDESAGGREALANLAGSTKSPEKAVSSADDTVAGTITRGGMADVKLLEIAMRALDEWEVERGIKISKERRPAVIAILYDYLQKGNKDAVDVVLRALG